MLKYVCLALIVSVVYGALTVKDCGNNEIKEIKVSSCNDAPCGVKSASNVTFEIKFTAGADSAKVDFQLAAIVNGQTIDLPDNSTDDCSALDRGCPVKIGIVYDIKVKVIIPTTLPKMAGELRAKLVGDKGNLFCGSVPVTFS